MYDEIVYQNQLTRILIDKSIDQLAIDYLE